VRGIGFDFANKKDVWAKVKEELAEFEAEVEVDDTTKMEAEFGDLLFSLVNYSRHVNINPEDALERTNKKFRKRFQAMENAIHVDNKNLSDMNLAQMDVYWEKVKKELES
jgi:XTP/dITP diphosphohydrolase